MAWVNEAEDQLRQAAQLLRGNRENLLGKLSAALERTQQLEKEVQQLKARAASAAGSAMASGREEADEARKINGLWVLIKRETGVDGKGLLELIEQLKNKLGSAVSLHGGELDGKVVLVAGITGDLTGRVKAGDLTRQTAK